MGPVKIVIGLGNPGKQYESTRHNVGWMVLDKLADRAGWTGHAKARDAAATVYGRYQDMDLLLAKPTTYMNLSGVAVRKLVGQAPRAAVGSLDSGRRLRPAAGQAAHARRRQRRRPQRLKSIIAELGTQDFARLRVGIGEPQRSAVDHVLNKFTTAERKTVDEVAGRGSRCGRGLGPIRRRSRGQPMERLAAGGDGRARRAFDAGPRPATPDKDGIVRRKTGWRRLLPGGGAAK
jgi:PTH1 family peptidyl-tRNA hydrolase